MVDVWDRKAESDGQKATTTHNSSSPATTANNNEKTHSLTKAQLAAAAPSQLLHATADDKAPSYVHTAGIVLSQLLLWHRALLHFQPSSGALPILLSSPASSSGGHALFVREEAEELADLLWQIGCGLFFVWSGWKAAHAFSSLSPTTALRLDARNPKQRSWVDLLWKLVFKPLRRRVTLFLPAYMLTVSLVHLVVSSLSSSSGAGDVGAHFNYFHIHVCSHLLLFFPYSLTMWVVHCPLFYAITQAQEHVSFSWSCRLLAGLTPAALLFSLPLVASSWHLAQCVLLVYGPLLVCVALRPAIRSPRAKSITLLLAAMLIYGGRLAVGSTDHAGLKLAHSSLVAFVGSLVARHYPAFVANSALYVLGFLWVHYADAPSVGHPPPAEPKGESQWVLILFGTLSFLVAASLLSSSFEESDAFVRLCRDYFVLLVALLIKYCGDQPFEGLSERLLRDSSFLVFLLHPVCASLVAVALSATATSLPFLVTLALLVGGTVVLCHGCVWSVLLFAPPPVCAFLVRFNNRCLSRMS